MNWTNDSVHKQEENGYEYTQQGINSAPRPQAVDSGKGFAVRVRGIPFQESEFTVYQWLTERGINVRNGPLGVQLHYTGRQWSGDAYVALESARDIEIALSHNNAQMNHRYLEFFPTTYAEMENQLKVTGLYRFPNEYNIRLRGLEYKVTKEAIANFFPGLEIATGLDGIIICANDEGRSTGEGYVLFENKASVIQAIQRHKEKMGERYIEIFLASSAQILESYRCGRGGAAEREYGHGYPEEAYRAGSPLQGPTMAAYPDAPRVGYPNKYPPAPALNWADDRRSPMMDSYRGADRRSEPKPYAPPLGLHRLYMRGLPWKCTEVEIQQFFAPIPVRSVTKNLTPANVFDGSAWVEFPTAEAMEEGKKKDRSNMGHRYVELFTVAEHEAQRPRTGRDDRGRGSSKRTERNDRPRRRSRSRERSYGRSEAPVNYQSYSSFPNSGPPYAGGQPQPGGYGQGYAHPGPMSQTSQYASQYANVPHQQGPYGIPQTSYPVAGADNGWN